MRALLPVALALSLHAAPAQAQTPDYAGMDTLLSRLDRANKASGSVLLYKNGQVLYRHHFGQATTKNGTPVPATDATAYRLGSITKVYTATMIWQLIEAGKLTPETRLSRFFPTVPNAKDITIGQMLSHHSGLHNITDDLTFGRWGLQPRTRAELLARIVKGTPEFAPGTKGEYSNTNYMLLSFLLEDITKKSYAANLKERILAPLHLTGTRAGVAGPPAPGDALSYSYRDGSWNLIPAEDLSTAAGAGNIVANPLDVARFLEALMTGKLVSEASLTQMKTQKDGFGMGLFEIPFGKRRSYGHGGHIDGTTTAADYAPSDSLELVIACNGVNTDFNEISVGILKLYYNRPYTIPDFSPKAPATVDPETLQRYTGVYTFAPAKMDITVRLDGGVLMTQATGQASFPLTAVSQTEFSYEPAGIVIIFGKPENGTVKEFVLQQGGSTVPFERKP